MNLLKTISRPINLITNKSTISFVAFLFAAISIQFSSCKTIAYHDANSFVKTAELKAKTLVVISHANEDFSKYADKVDDLMVMAETIYAMQKARELNYLTVKQWELLIRKTGPQKLSILYDFFDMWKKRGTLNEYFVGEAKEQIGAAFDEILKLEDKKLRK